MAAVSGDRDIGSRAVDDDGEAGLMGMALTFKKVRRD